MGASKFEVPGCCEVRLRPEQESGYSAYVPALPGVVSEGETREEALRNITEALGGVLWTYVEGGNPIPWSAEPEPLADGDIRAWVVVDLES